MIQVERSEDRVAVVYLDNPPLNLLTLQMTQRLIDLFSELEEDDGVRAVVIAGTGRKAFCAGADIKEFAAVRDDVVEKKLRKENEALARIEGLSKPVIAAMDGSALGGGCEIALSCDLRILAEDARIGLPEIKLGVFPGSGGLYRLPRIVGLSSALRMMYTGDLLTAREAHAIGLVDEVAEPGRALAAARELAARIARGPRHALAAIRAGVRRSLEVTRDEAIRYNLELSDRVFRTPDCAEGVDAFFQKRAPRFD